MSVKGPPQIRAARLGGQQIFPIASHGFFVIQLKADFFPLYLLPQGVQRVLVIKVDGSVDEVVCRDYQSDARETSVLARSVLGKNTYKNTLCKYRTLKVKKVRVHSLLTIMSSKENE